MEHINRFLLQLGEVDNQDALRVRLFSLSLSGSAFAWFTTLPANSILYWADLERQFHQFFFSGVTELKLTDLTGLRQKNDESVAAFIQKFRDVKNRCYSLVLSDQQLTDVAFNGLLPHIKDKYGSQKFENRVEQLSTLASLLEQDVSMCQCAVNVHLLIVVLQTSVLAGVRSLN